MESKVIVITGASDGIGALAAQLLARQGHRLVLAARRKAELEAVAATCGGDALAVVTDVTVRGQVQRLADAAIARFGHIDVWVNNAGRGIFKPVMQLTDADVDDVLAANLKSALYGMQAAVPHFQHRGKGHLINISSFLSRVPMASVRSIYSASKAALNSLTANLRTDLKATHPGIAVTLVIPGLVDTRFGHNALNAPADYAPPPGMVAQPAIEVAQVIVDAIANPVPEVYTNPAQAPVAVAYIKDVGAFEAQAARR